MEVVPIVAKYVQVHMSACVLVGLMNSCKRFVTSTAYNELAWSAKWQK